MTRSLQTALLLCAALQFTDSKVASLAILSMMVVCLVYMFTVDEWEREIRDIERRLGMGER